MTWMVTGGSGFLGRSVLAALEASGEQVVALGRNRPAGWPVERFARADLDDPIGLARAVEMIAPDVVIHAAGKTPPAPAHALYLANTRATMFLLESLRAEGRPCRVVLAGSAAELGPVPCERLPAREDEECRPTDAYGLSKWAATRLGLMQGAPLSVTVARIFNPIGPGMPASQAFGRFAATLAEPGAEVLRFRVGDLAARRDFLDVRDAASALIALGRDGRPGSIYHVGTGRSRPVEDGLRELIRLSGRAVEVEEATACVRRGPSDSFADVSRIAEHVGWRAEIPFEASLADLWAEARRGAGARRVA